MGKMGRYLGSAAIVGLITGSAAWADVTAKQVWDNWKSTAEAAGQSVSAGSENESGGTLSLKDVKVVSTTPDGKVSGTIANVTFAEQGDGTVKMTMSPDYPVDFDMTPKDGKPVVGKVMLHQEGLSVIVSGSDGDMTYALDAPSIEGKLASLTVDGKPADVNVDFKAIGSKATYAIKGTGTRDITSNGTAQSMSLAVDGTDPEKGGKFSFSAKATDLTGTSAATMIDGVDMKDMDAALKAGTKIDATLGYGGLTYSFDTDDAKGTSKGEGTGKDGKLTIAMTKAGLHYGVSGGGGSLTVSGSQIPLPQITLKTTGSTFDFMMPVMKSPDPQPFSILVKLAGVALNDEVWGMLDPGKVLPRDPAELAIDLAGKATLTRDVLAQPGGEMPGSPPGQLDSVDVNNVHLAIGGADLSGKGAFTFDHSGDMPGNPMGQPSGMIDLTLKGGMGLLDKLVTMGLVPQDQATGFKMMLGLFAKPGDAPDTMVSKIELTKDGQVLANGQRLK